MIGVPTLLSLAYNVSQFDGIICAILDAKNDNVYAGLYRKNESNKLVLIDNYISDTIDVLIQEVKNHDFHSPILFVGDGSETYNEKLRLSLGGIYTLQFAPPHLNVQYALSVARAAEDMAMNGEFDDYHSLTPLYLKKSQAERMLENKESS